MFVVKRNHDRDGRQNVGVGFGFAVGMTNVVERSIERYPVAGQRVEPVDLIQRRFEFLLFGGENVSGTLFSRAFSLSFALDGVSVVPVY